MKCITEYKSGLNIKSTSRSHSIMMDMTSPLGENKGMTPGELLMNSIAGCKMITFVSLAKLNNVTVEDLVIEVTGNTENIGFVDNIKVPKKLFKSIHIIYKVKTPNTNKEIREYLKLVDECCTVANALSKDIKVTDEVIIL